MTEIKMSRKELALLTPEQRVERRRRQRVEASRRWRERNPRVPKERPTPRTAEETREHLKKYSRAWRVSQIYNISEAKYYEMLEAQNGVCAICLRPPPEGKHLDIDHDHACCPGGGSRGGRKCGKCIRGLLCRSCNSAMHMVENPDKMERALAYLARFEQRAA